MVKKQIWNGYVTKMNDDYIFFDNASTTRIDDSVLEVMLPFLKENYGNASSLHKLGQEASNSLENARKSVASLIGAKDEEIYFTSCSTESNNMALRGILRAYKDKGDHIITSSIEHYSILNPLKDLQREGWEMTVLPVDKFGSVDPDEVKKAIGPKTMLVSIMHANNEIGTIQNLKEISRITRESGVILHSDCTATAGIIPVDVNKVGLDCISFSSQQMYGPKGAGALYLKKGIKIRPVLLGGIQESGRRAGTENIAAIAGFGLAAKLAKDEMTENTVRVKELRDNLYKGIMKNIDKVLLNGHPDERLPGNLHLSFEYIEGESIILLLNFEGIAASSGSSCASHALKTSHVLTSINVPPELANGSILFSLGKYNTKKEVDKVVSTMPAIVNKLRQMSPLCR
jgi:cysteine desulfurase